jgi:hypothetical protein
MDGLLAVIEAVSVSLQAGSSLSVTVQVTEPLIPAEVGFESVTVNVPAGPLVLRLPTELDQTYA